MRCGKPGSQRKRSLVTKPTYRVEIKRVAQKAIAQLDRDLQRQLSEAIRKLGENPRPHGYVQMKAQKEKLYRIRVREWRIIYTIEEDVLLVVVVRLGPRGDVYEGY